MSTAFFSPGEKERTVVVQFEIILIVGKCWGLFFPYTVLRLLTHTIKCLSQSLHAQAKQSTRLISTTCSRTLQRDTRFVGAFSKRLWRFIDIFQFTCSKNTQRSEQFEMCFVPVKKKREKKKKKGGKKRYCWSSVRD